MCEALVCVFFVCSLWLQHFELVSQALVLAINNGSGIGDPMHLMIIWRTSTIGMVLGMLLLTTMMFHILIMISYTIQPPSFFLEGQVLTGFCL